MLKIKSIGLIFVFILVVCVGAQAQLQWNMADVRDIDNILPQEEQANIFNEWLEWRLDNIVPMLMKREGIDMWIVMNREYNEDPLYLSMVHQPNLNARRLSVLIFHNSKQGFKKLTASWHGTSTCGDYYTLIFKDKSNGWKGQFTAIADYIKKSDPQKIGLNFSEHWQFGDGLSAGLLHEIETALDKKYQARIVSAENLCIGWLETRSPEQLKMYRNIIGIGHDLIKEFFSNQVIVPGVTTTNDVVWWIRDRIANLGLKAWFQPSISIQRSPVEAAQYEKEDRVIRRGDLLHCDVGFKYLGLCTDQQHNAYVLRIGETAPPKGLQELLHRGNRLQEIFLNEFKEGRTGNEIYLSALKIAKAEGLKPRIYTHPIGVHGHAAGPTLGLYEDQDGVPVAGDYPLYQDTCYSIELSAAYEVPEWGNQLVNMGLEEEAVFTKDGGQWIDGYQTKLYLIK